MTKIFVKERKVFSYLFKITEIKNVCYTYMLDYLYNDNYEIMRACGF